MGRILKPPIGTNIPFRFKVGPQYQGCSPRSSFAPLHKPINIFDVRSVSFLAQRCSVQHSI
jgi:hypothetical protein